MPSSTEIRNTFIEYFTNNDHTYVPGSSIIPKDDDSILFVNSGMCQFKNIFLGKEKPKHEAVCNYQKCIRAGGKHNDFESVGNDDYHHTFFEMLGTWSFGKYYKEQTIDYAWDLLVNVYKIDSSRLYVTYFDGDSNLNLPQDEETKTIWKKYLPENKIIPFKMADNFWEMASTGPCGPCTEIHYSYLEGDQSCKVNTNSSDVIEIWNMVFMEYNRTGETTFEQLDTKYVDTGMGLERLVSIVQGKQSNYDTDIFEPIMNAICCTYNNVDGNCLAAYRYVHDDEFIKMYRVIADHIRCIIIAINDGVVFENTGRGYIIRKIYRRMTYYTSHFLKLNGLNEFIVSQIVKKNIDAGISIYINKTDTYIIIHMLMEFRLFKNVLRKGVKMINKIIKQTNNFTGENMGKIYTTYGFPPILTKDICQSNGIKVNIDEFDEYMKNHTKLSKK